MSVHHLNDDNAKKRGGSPSRHAPHIPPSVDPMVMVAAIALGGFDRLIELAHAPARAVWKIGIVLVLLLAIVLAWRLPWTALLSGPAAVQ